jgi:hypothetical protein
VLSLSVWTPNPFGSVYPRTYVHWRTPQTRRGHLLEILTQTIK